MPGVSYMFLNVKMKIFASKSAAKACRVNIQLHGRVGDDLVVLTQVSLSHTVDLCKLESNSALPVLVLHSKSFPC